MTHTPIFEHVAADVRAARDHLHATIHHQHHPHHYDQTSTHQEGHPVSIRQRATEAEQFLAQHVAALKHDADLIEQNPIVPAALSFAGAVNPALQPVAVALLEALAAKHPAAQAEPLGTGTPVEAPPADVPAEQPAA